MELDRRTFLKAAIVLPGLTAALGGLGRADSSKASQASMHYQTSPNGSAHCAVCQFFIPGANATADGSCKVVDGSISPNGYCIAYAARSN
jgi:hypothetical protein